MAVPPPNESVTEWSPVVPSRVAVTVTLAAGCPSWMYSGLTDSAMEDPFPRSASTEYWVAARLPTPEILSVATFAATSTVTVPVAAGAMVTRKSCVSPRNPVTLPLPTVTSFRSNPLTDSENWITTWNSPV